MTDTLSGEDILRLDVNMGEFYLSTMVENSKRYEACGRAKHLGAKRATVISDQDFYYKIGFTLSSEVHCWGKNSATT